MKYTQGVCPEAPTHHQLRDFSDLDSHARSGAAPSCPGRSARCTRRRGRKRRVIPKKARAVGAAQARDGNSWRSSHQLR